MQGLDLRFRVIVVALLLGYLFQLLEGVHRFGVVVELLVLHEVHELQVERIADPELLGRTDLGVPHAVVGGEIEEKVLAVQASDHLGEFGIHHLHIR